MFLPTYLRSMARAFIGHLPARLIPGKDVNNPQGAIIYIHGLYQSPLIMQRLANAISTRTSDHNSFQPFFFGYKAYKNHLGERDIADVLVSNIKQSLRTGSEIVLVGHSLGGRIAALAAAQLKDEFDISVVYIASPVNGAQSAKVLSKLLPDSITGAAAKDLHNPISLPDVKSCFILGMQYGINRSLLSTAPGDGVVFDAECLPNDSVQAYTVSHVKAGHTNILYKADTCDIIAEFIGALV